MATQRQIITKTMSAGTLAFGLLLQQATPAGADDVDPDPFRGLSCSCSTPTPFDIAAAMSEIRRGLHEGHSAWLPELPATAG